jgi:hypothetical protein
VLVGLLKRIDRKLGRSAAAVGTVEEIRAFGVREA